MTLDADALGVPAARLIPLLQDLFDIERQYALQKAAVLRKYRREEKR